MERTVTTPPTRLFSWLTDAKEGDRAAFTEVPLSTSGTRMLTVIKTLAATAETSTFD